MTVLLVVLLCVLIAVLVAASLLAWRAGRSVAAFPRALHTLEEGLRTRLDMALDTAEERFGNLANVVERQGADAEELHKFLGVTMARLRYFESNDPRLKRLSRHLDSSNGEKKIGEPWLPGETEARQAASVMSPSDVQPIRRCPECDDQRVSSQGRMWCLACGYANPGVSCRRCGRHSVAPDHLAPQGHACFTPDPNFQTVPDSARAARLQPSPTFAARSAHQCSS